MGKTEWKSQTHSIKQKQYPDALSVAEEALKVAEDTFGTDHPKVAISLNNIAELYIIKRFICRN